MELVEITREEVINNCEEYFENKQQFFIKTKYERGLRSAYIYQWEEYDIFGEIKLVYCFDYDNCDSSEFEDEDIEHIYIIQ